MPNSIAYINCNLPAFDSFLADHVVILATILSTSGIHWFGVSFFVESGMHKYLNGSCASDNPVC